MKQKMLDLMVQSETEVRVQVVEEQPQQQTQQQTAPAAGVKQSFLAQIAAGAADDDDDDEEEEVQIGSLKDECEREMKAYLKADKLPIEAPAESKEKYNNPLEWWKKYQSVFPKLARLAKVYLSIQATSAPTERVFSCASRVIGEKKVRMKPENAGKLLYVSRNWQWYQNEINLEQVMNVAGEEAVED